MIAAWCWPDSPCARCLYPVAQADAVGVWVVEPGTMREFGQWAHADRTQCAENLR